MNFIGNILTDEQMDHIGPFNITDMEGSLIKGIPTLIIGWERTRKLYPEVSIINWEIESGVTYWTFGEMEKRDRYERDLNRFVEVCVDDVLSRITYIPINLLIDNTDKCVSVLSESTRTYVSGTMVYSYDGLGTVYGVSVDEAKYIGLDIARFIDRNKTILDDGAYGKVKAMFRNKKYVIPYIYSN